MRTCFAIIIFYPFFAEWARGSFFFAIPETRGIDLSWFYYLLNFIFKSHVTVAKPKPKQCTIYKDVYYILFSFHTITFYLRAYIHVPSPRGVIQFVSLKVSRFPSRPSLSLYPTHLITFPPYHFLPYLSLHLYIYIEYRYQTML